MPEALDLTRPAHQRVPTRENAAQLFSHSARWSLFMFSTSLRARSASRQRFALVLRRFLGPSLAAAGALLAGR
jgi:hypothetical protein